MLNSKIFSLVEQALVSLLNFGSIFLISKYLSVEKFAEYTIAYSYTVFLFLLSTAMFSSPVLVFYIKKWFHQGKAYFLSNLLWAFLTIIIVCGLLFPFLSNQVEGVSFLKFFLFCFGLFFYDFVRKFFYVLKERLLLYLVAGSFLLNVTFFSVLFINRLNLTLSYIFNTYAICFIGFSCLLFLVLIGDKSFLNKKKTNNIWSIKFHKEIFNSQFVFSRWVILGGALYWGYTQGIYIASEYLSYSSEEIAKTRLIQNFTNAFAIVAISMENHYNPIFSGLKNGLKEKITEIYKYQYKKILLLFLLAIPIGLIVYQLIYFEKYGVAYVLFFGMLIHQLFMIGAKLFEVALKSVEATKSFFLSQIYALAGALITLFTVAYFNLSHGILFAMIVAAIIYSFAIYYFYNKKVVDEK